jgi:hypothetical protein
MRQKLQKKGFEMPFRESVSCAEAEGFCVG